MAKITVGGKLYVFSALKNCLGLKEEVAKNDNTDPDAVIRNARTMKEITDKVHQFEYKEFKKGGKVLCVICNTDFDYSQNLAADFTEGHMDRKFSNLKTSLMRHISDFGPYQNVSSH